MSSYEADVGTASPAVTRDMGRSTKGRPERGGLVLDSAAGLGGNCSPVLGEVEAKGTGEPGLQDKEMETPRSCPRGSFSSWSTGHGCPMLRE